ncbi:MAG: hypothetical protein U9Q29_01355 [Campylobacterota bacterium]|nr:hypothetical protein [Campylobacterota bacterium]
MIKGLLLVLKINLVLIFSVATVSCSDKPDNLMDDMWKFAYNGYNYGYSLPKSKTASTADMSNNVIKCTHLETVMEQYYCICR